MCNGPKPLKHKEIKELREKLWEENGRCCPICGAEVDKSEIALDHSHKSDVDGTGQIRNAICKKCNSLEGIFKQKWKRIGLMDVIEFSDLLISMGEYLKQEHLPYLHPSEVQKKPKLMKRSYNQLKREIEKVNCYLEKPIKIPPYPKSKRLTKRLKELYDQFGLVPEFYSK
jgi:RNase P subunit RPR2